MDAARHPRRDRAAQGLAIQTNGNLTASSPRARAPWSRCSLREEVRDEAAELLWINRRAEDPVPSRGVGHRRTIKPEQVSQRGRAQLRPIGDCLRGVLFREFGEGGNGQEDGEGIADAARIALVGEREQAGIEGEGTEEEGNAGQGDGERRRGRLHGTPFLVGNGSAPQSYEVRCFLSLAYRIPTLQQPWWHDAILARIPRSR